MSDQLELDRNPGEVELELDAPPTTTPTPISAKPGALSGALVQRGRERAPRLMESSMPIELPSAVALAAPRQPAPPPAAVAPASSRWTDVIFAAACCIAFFATFLFVLHF